MTLQESKRNDHQNIPTGSPQQGEPLYLVVGRLRRSHGLQGEILCEILTDFPERLKVGKLVYRGETHVPEVITGIREHGNGLLIRFKGKESLEQIEAINNEWICVKADELPPLPDGEFYFHELIGLQVYDESEQYLGQLKEILETGANDVYLILTPEGKELLLPAIEPVIKQILVHDGKIIVAPPEWY